MGFPWVTYEYPLVTLGNLGNDVDGCKKVDFQLGDRWTDTF